MIQEAVAEVRTRGGSQCRPLPWMKYSQIHAILQNILLPGVLVSPHGQGIEDSSLVQIDAFL